MPKSETDYETKSSYRSGGVFDILVDRSYAIMFGRLTEHSSSVGTVRHFALELFKVVHNPTIHKLRALFKSYREF